MNNCLFFAIGLYIKHGGYIVFRKSNYGKWSHVMWTNDLKEFSHYVPLNPPLRYPLIQKIYFKGRVKTETFS